MLPNNLCVYYKNINIINKKLGKYQIRPLNINQYLQLLNIPIAL